MSAWYIIVSEDRPSKRNTEYSRVFTLLKKKKGGNLKYKDVVKQRIAHSRLAYIGV